MFQVALIVSYTYRFLYKNWIPIYAYIYIMYMIYDVDSNWQLDWMKESKMFGENELRAGLVSNVKTTTTTTTTTTM